MRLLKVRLENFRRFEKTDALLVADRLIAVVGPNEAGKTSLLTALDQIDRLDDRLPQRFATRQSGAPPKVSALFEIDPIEAEQLAGIPDTQDLRRFWIHRTTQGTRWNLERRPARNVEHRESVSSALLAIEQEPALVALLSDPDEPELAEDFEAAKEACTTEDETLAEGVLGALRRCASMINGLSAGDPDDVDEDLSEEDVEAHRADLLSRNRALTAAGSALADMAAVEALETPAQLTIQVLKELVPPVVTFSAVDRELQTDYDLDDYFSPDEDGDLDEIPQALQNIADLADLDLAKLHKAMNGDPGTVMLLKRSANEALDNFFNKNYAQSDVAVQIDHSGTLLRLMSRAEGGEDFIEISEKSEGFKWFLALVAFLARREYEKPIVLIDEIETHLHYTAQADVIDILTTQNVAPQVIYTTHSAGCLPPDLGRGVRAVEQVPARQRSRINNAFWTSGPGTSPLLFGLGASTLALSIPKLLVIVEGPSDAVLLPTLIRQATGLVNLPYRIAPGIASTRPSDFTLLDAEGGRVVYLVDADAEGDSYLHALQEAGVASNRTVSWRQILSGVVSPEDLVRRPLLLEAANLEGEPFWLGKRIGDADIPSLGASKAIEEWCKANELQPPSKTRIAQNLVERTWDWLLDDESSREAVALTLADETRQAEVGQLHAHIMAAMNL